MSKNKSGQVIKNGRKKSKITREELQWLSQNTNFTTKTIMTCHQVGRNTFQYSCILLKWKPSLNVSRYSMKASLTVLFTSKPTVKYDGASCVVGLLYRWRCIVACKLFRLSAELLTGGTIQGKVQVAALSTFPISSAVAFCQAWRTVTAKYNKPILGFGLLKMGKAKEKAAAGAKYKKAKPKISLKKEDLQWLSENTKFGQEELRSWNKVVFTKLLIWYT